MKKKIRLYYDDLRKKRSSLDNWEVGEKYQEVIEKYNKSLSDEDYLLSFLLIQNLLEDRLYVLLKYVLEHETKVDDGYGSDLTLEHYHSHFPSLKRILWELSERDIIDHEEFRVLNRSVIVRNRYVHFSFMSQDVYTKELSETFYDLFREVDSIVQRFKKTVE
jgi:hypothetical protein